MKTGINYKLPVALCAPVFLLLAFIFSSCSSKYKWIPKEESGIQAADLEGKWTCDSARSAGKYYSKTISITSNNSSIIASEGYTQSDQEVYFRGAFSENPFTVKHYVRTPSSGALEFTLESVCEVGVYSKDSILLIITDDYRELYVRDK